MNTNLRILYILKYLENNSDEEHTVTIAELIRHLETLGINVGRRTVPEDIEALIEFGIDIVKVKSTQNRYFIASRSFEIPEIKLLLDAIYSSKLITPKKSKRLSEKIKSLVSEHQRELFNEKYFITQRLKPTNENVLLNIDKLHKAINEKKQITFQYFDYMPDKTKILKNDGERYRLSPYSLAWNNDKYYLFGFSEKHKKIVTFRVDRITKIYTLSKDIIPSPKNLNIADYCKKVFEMYDGEYEIVSLKCKNEAMKIIIDKFGENVHTEIIDDEYFLVKVEVSVSKLFYGWVFELNNLVTLTAPKNVVIAYKNELKKSI